MDATAAAVAECRMQAEAFDAFLRELQVHAVGGTHSVSLHPVERTRDLNPSVAEMSMLAAPLQQRGMEVVARGGVSNVWLFAFPADTRGSLPRQGAFLWAPVHSGLGAWWLMTAWRLQQMARAVIDLAEQRLVLPAAACSRAVLETAAATRYDAERWTGYWHACREYGPTDAEPVPSALYRELHNYVVEMLVGGKFKGELPTDIRMLATEPISRINIQTCIDHLNRMNPRVTQTYDVLCNAVHPSVASTLSFVDEVSTPSPGEVRMTVRSHGARESAVGGRLPSTWDAVITGVNLGIEVAMEALDASLRAIDDLCLTVGLGHYKHATHWRCLTTPQRNERCPCRSGRKSKDCPHVWGAGDADALQEAEIRKRSG